jgi:predicted nucleic acid-binding protein
MACSDDAHAVGAGHRHRDQTFEEARTAGLYANAYARSHQGISLEDFLLAAAAKLNRCPLWTGNRKHYPMDDIQLF